MMLATVTTDTMATGTMTAAVTGRGAIGATTIETVTSGTKIETRGAD